MGDKRIIVTDRSRTDSYQRCHRYRYLAYHWDGTGWRPDRFNADISIGIAVHEGIGSLLDSIRNGVTVDKGTVNLACKIALDRLEKDFETSPFDFAGSVGEGDQSSNEITTDLIMPSFADGGLVDEYTRYFTSECKSLVELLIRAWAISDQGLRKLLSEYEIIDVEREEVFKIYEGRDYDLVFMSRPDAILRRRLDNELFAFSLKTTKTWDYRKDIVGETDMQGMSEVVAIENRLGEQCGGVQMLYLLTGESRKNSSGFKERSSGVLRPWIKPGVMGDEEFAFSYQWESGGKVKRLPKDYQRRNCWELGMTIAEYVEAINQFDEMLGANPLNTLIVQPGVYERSAERLARWQSEVTYQEAKIAQGLIQIESANKSNDRGKEAELMSEYFPHYSSSCVYPTPCSYREVCWGSPYAKEDPINSGFARREPHHDLERDIFANEGKDK